MKRFTQILMFGLAVCVQPALLSADISQAQAAVRKNVSEYAGERCTPPPVGSGVIVGRYTGTSDNGMISFGDGMSTIWELRCFTSMSECQGWLYTMRSKYTDGNSVLISCKRR
ncbi:metallophosphoesterase [Phyllobacterium sp. SB3]|uniref:metallophosphoesterase n=1 Tax=Phyllobacterium sp. SB3 TaxID=3156073 RepID=UPI0032AE9D88